MAKEIEIKMWIGGGGIATNAYALDWDHPMHPYNQAIDQGVEPEAYGIKSPLHEEFEDWSRSKLMREIMELRKDLIAIHREYA